MENFTTIQLEKNTATKLKTLKITKLETYNEIILRLIKNYEKIKGD